ncbi:MAG: response regulator [Kiritimatiellae bacterium]|jgi:signal transduction histidine kinase/CheY-like chemotaxis protein/HAMP domain-containing protein|nr:response regulator [Kiritimatiellia bacterium]
MFGKLHFRHLRTRLIFWFLTVTLLSLITVIAVQFILRTNGIKRREFEKLTILRDLKAEQINYWLKERVTDLSIVAENKNIQNLGRDLIHNSDNITEKQLTDVNDIFQNYVDYFSYVELFFISSNSGRVIVSTSKENIGKDKNTFLPFAKTIETKKTNISDIYYSDTNQDITEMAFSAPVFAMEKDGEHIVGVVVMIIDPEHVLYPLIQKNIGLGDTGETLIVNKEGFALNELRWHENAPLKLKITATPAAKAVAKKTGLVKTKDYRGEEVLAAYTYIPRTHWGLIVKRDYADIYSPINSVLKHMIYIVISMAVLVVIASLLLGRSIARPIVNMKKTVNKFIDGDLNARCNTAAGGKDEIASLKKAFNKMAETLSLQILVRNGITDISETMVSTNDTAAFANKLLSHLVDLADAQFGAFYMIETNSLKFTMQTSIGLNENTNLSFCATEKEGEMGRAIITGKISIIQNIPQDTKFTFKTTAGTIVPKEIMTIPISVGKKVMAVISLGKLNTFEDTFYQIVEEEKRGMNTTLAKLLSDEKTNLLNEELSTNNTELKAQTTELEQQAHELQQQTDELTNQQIQVEEANRLKSEFLSNMSHELRTPLNSVLSLSQLMLTDQKITANKTNKERIEIIERNGKHLLSLINDILDISKIESGKTELFVQLFSVEELIHPIVAAIRPMAAEKNLKINVNLDSNIETITSDKDKLQQILLNLMSNAQKFTQQGHIDIDVQKQGQYAKFIIRDTGIGIPQKALNHIFDEFRQVDGSTTRRYGGTGLGLAICRKLSALLGGTISVDSKEGEGSAFTLTIPLIIEHHTTVEIENENAVNIQGDKLPLAGNNPHILIVEDNKVAREQVTRIMLAEGFKADVAVNGEEALEITKKHIPDAMILDLMMPAVDGFQVVKAIRANTATAQLPILVLTAKDLNATERASLSYNNVQQLIQKGNLDKDMLVNTVKKIIGIPINSNIKKTQLEKSSNTSIIIPKKITLKKGKKLSILVVDDYVDNLTTTIAIIKSIMKDIPLEIFEARDGKEAVEAAEAQHPDIIFMDIQMPVMGGMEATRKIKQNADLKDTIIIALTASAMIGDKEEIMDSGCDDYLSKPVEPESINNAIRKWIGDKSDYERG